MGERRSCHTHSHYGMSMRSVCIFSASSTRITELSRVVSAVAWSVVYSYGIWGAIELAILMIIRDYLLVGALIATILWYEVPLPAYPYWGQRSFD